jgi:hypothetical protein
MSTPAGWYADPAGVDAARWWDGQNWTEHTQPAPPAPVLTMAAAAPGAPVGPTPAASGVPHPVAAPAYAEGYRAATVTAYTPAAAPGRSWTKPVLAVVLVGLLAIGGWFGYQQLRPATPAAAPASAGVATGADPGVALTVKAAQPLVESFQPVAPFLKPGASARLIPQGDLVGTQRTLAGVCATEYASDQTRIARRQWGIYAGETRGPSIEVVAYRTTAEASKALAELSYRVSKCRNTAVEIRGVPAHQTKVASSLFTPASGVAGVNVTIATVATSDDGRAVRFFTNGVAQQRGQFLTIMWANQLTAFSAADRTALLPLVQNQTAALRAATTPPTSK